MGELNTEQGREPWWVQSNPPWLMPLLGIELTAHHSRVTSSRMEDAAGSILASLGRVRLVDLTACEGLPTDNYKICVSTLMQSLAQYSAAIIQLPPTEGALLRSGLDSAGLFFHQRGYSSSEAVHLDDAREWCKTSGYYVDHQMWLETYDYRPGVTVTEPNGPMELPPSGLPDIFAVLGKVSRDILDAISFSLNLRSCAFTDILDNIPLRSQEVSSSVLSECCHSRPSFEGARQHSIASQDDGQLIIFADQDQQMDKTLLTLVRSDRSGLYVKDMHGQWILVDGDLGPNDVVVYPGLALYQETAGYVNPAVYKTDVGNLQGCMFGRCSLVFKLMPRSVARLSGSEMRAAGHGVDAQFQVPIPVNDFMQTGHSVDQLFPKDTEPSSHAEQDSGNLVPLHEAPDVPHVRMLSPPSHSHYIRVNDNMSLPSVGYMAQKKKSYLLSQTTPALCGTTCIANTFCI